MTSTMRRLGIGIGTTAIVAIVAAGVYANTQNTSGQDPASGRRGGPGGPGGPGRRGGPPPDGLGRGGPMGPMGGILGPMAAERLGLTDSQLAQITAAAQSHEAELKDLNDRSFAAHQALESAITAETVNEGAIRARSADLAAIDADMAVTRARMRAEVLQMLTPEQRAKANEMPQPRGDRRPPPQR